MRDNIEIITILLDYLNIDSKIVGRETASPLEISFCKKSATNCLLFHHPRIDLNAFNGYGYALLHTQVNNPDRIKLLLKDSRINPNIKTCDGKTALHLAMNHRYSETAKLLIKDPRTNLNILYSDSCHQGETPLMLAIEWMRETEILTYLARDQRCDPNIQDNNGETALHHAARYPFAAKALLESSYHSIDFNIKNKKGKTAVDEIKLYASYARYDDTKEAYQTIFQIISENQKKNSDFQKNNSSSIIRVCSIFTFLINIFKKIFLIF